MIQQLQLLGIEVRDGMRGNVKVSCPKCSNTRKNKKDPCLSVDVTEGVWNCHNCGWKGTAFKKSVKEYVKPLQELKILSEPLIQWFAARGISNQTLLRYKITEGIDYMPQVGSDVKTIHFNYYYNGEIQNIKYRDRDKNFKLVSGARLCPYGMDIVLDNATDYIVITEGEIDALSFYEAGIKSVVSVPNGASKGSQKIEWLDDFYSLFDGKKIYLATDMDDAGISLRNELARRLGKHNCLLITLPLKDANEVLVLNGPEALAECFLTATPFPVEGIDDAFSVKEDLLRLYDEGVPKGYDTGFEEDFIHHPGQVTLITGIPGHGKSTFLKNIMYRLAKRHGQRFFIYSAEEANTASALADMYQIATGKTFFKSPLAERITREELDEWIPFMNDHFKYYRLYDNDLSIEGILAKAQEMVKRFGINALIIDNMSTVEKSMSNNSDTRHHQIKVMMTDIARFARNFDVHVYLVAHPKKMTEVKTGVYKVPNGYDVGDSSHWFNLPDNGITIYRNFETHQTDQHRWKVRFKYSGKTGVNSFSFNVNNSRYDLAERINDGSDKTKFIGQSYGTKDIETFASLADPF